jgi:hemerythrin HHE cation binding domain-containing protein
MGNLDLYRRQHRALMAAATRLGAQVDQAIAGAAGVDGARACLADLSGRLMVHLQMEDRSLYPDLLRSERHEVRTTAARFQASLGALRAAAEAFSRRWLRPDAIERAPAVFSAELRPILQTLSDRIAAEDAELFPLVEP